MALIRRRMARMQRRTQTADETEQLGARLASTRPAGHVAPAIVYLVGELGAGKTTLARGFIHGCGVEGPVRSPTYTLVEDYRQGSVSIVHIDLYRLTDCAEVESLGLRDWLRPDTIWLVEWPMRAAGRLPPADLSVTLHAEPEGHEIRIEAGSAYGELWLKRNEVEMAAGRT
jgi:tRNA threonylcarbamoyladenosine biosynthesis protein TsaE